MLPPNTIAIRQLSKEEGISEATLHKWRGEARDLARKKYALAEASGVSFYRILRSQGQQHHRGRARAPVQRKAPTSYEANAPCQVWTWDITWSAPRLGYSEKAYVWNAK